MNIDQDVRDFILNWPEPKSLVLILGDLMLDGDATGRSHRKSPECDAPVLLNPYHEYRPGGAGAVALMSAAIGMEVAFVGAANMREIDFLASMLRRGGVDRDYLLVSQKMTTEKQRYIVKDDTGRRQVLRIDTEDTESLSATEEQIAVGKIRLALSRKPDIVLVSDYAKGVCTPAVIDALKDVRDRVIVDPPRGQSWDKYRGVSCMVPNREKMAGRLTPWVRSEMQTSCVIATDGNEGFRLNAGDENKAIHIPAHKVEVKDVCGCSDQFLAMLGVARAHGADWLLAAKLANLAAALKCEQYGATPVSLQRLKEVCE